MRVEKFSDYNRINEEFIGGLIKGALGKLFSMFAAPFKDMANDFKNAFKEEDPNSIKSIIMTNFNQAVDSAQKEMPNIKDESAVGDIMNKMVDSLVSLGNNVDKDVDTALGKDKSSGPKAVAKAIILGNKQAGWAGLVGLLDPSKGLSGIKTTYKYSKAEYDKALAAAGAKGGADVLKAKKDAASKFFDNLQKDIQSQLDKDFTEEEVKKIYDEAVIKGGGAPALDLKVGDSVIYLLKDKKKEDYDPNKKPEEQVEVVGVKKIEKIEGDNITFLDKDGKPTITKTMADIMGKTVVVAGENAKKVSDSLGKIKADDEKMGKVAKFADFIQDDANKDKVVEIEKILGGEVAAAI